MQLRASPYLSGLIDIHGVPELSMAETALASLSKLDILDDSISDHLLNAKQRFALGWSALTITQSESYSKLSALQCAFADETLRVALKSAWHQEAKTSKKNQMGETPDGLFILGLGKLGGFDLNFSSDVDLIAFYDPDILQIPKNVGQGYVVNKVLRRFTKIINPPRGGEFVWRVDWRLRPESSISQLGMATPAAENFYFFRALPWHRLALMKARCVAGDITTGAQFLKTLTPFIWRQNLDFRAIDELAHLKSRINLEHPSLQHERQSPAPITAQAEGFNLKLGSGGIREIEFIANALQLIWGGKINDLRTTHTLTALSKLAALGHLTPETAERLSHIYKYLRTTENAVQMIDNAHTHLVPKDQDAQNTLLTLLGHESYAAFSQDIETHRHFVNTEFKRLFSDPEASIDETAPPVHLADDLSERSQSILKNWQTGFGSYGIQADKYELYAPLGRQITKRIFDMETTTQFTRDVVIERIENFLKAVSRSEQYLRLLQGNPRILDALIMPLVYSPHMTTLLEQSPHIIDAYLAPGSYVQQKTGQLHTPDAAFVLSDTDYETRLERLRRFVNEGLFQYYDCFLQGRDTLAILQKNLTALAEVTLETTLTIAAHDMDEDSLPIAVLGLGKMGTQRMAPQSDLDLIFITGDDIDPNIAAKAIRRIRTILTAKLSEGIAYELDMRLRPSGRAGPPAVKLSSFMDHHMTRAKTWEHIALCSARVVAGDRDLGCQVEAKIEDILSRPRDTHQLRKDAQLMWHRLSEQRITKTPITEFNAKLREGGLMQAEYIQNCLRLAGQDTSDMNDAISFWSEQQIWERLLGLTDLLLENAPAHFKAFTPGENLQRAQYIQDGVIAETKQFFGTEHTDTDRVETSINWL